MKGEERFVWRKLQIISEANIFLEEMNLIWKKVKYILEKSLKSRIREWNFLNRDEFLLAFVGGFAFGVHVYIYSPPGGRWVLLLQERHLRICSSYLVMHWRNCKKSEEIAKSLQKMLTDFAITERSCGDQSYKETSSMRHTRWE